MSNSTCYWPNGGGVAEGYSPCDTGSSVSHCCNDNAYCFSNGLCLDSTQMTTYRGACTDESWSSAACPRYCLELSDGSYSNNVCGVWACDNNNQFACFPCTSESTDDKYKFIVNAGSIQRNPALDEVLMSTSIAASTSTTPTSQTPSSLASTSATLVSQTPSSVVSCLPSTPSTATCPSHVGAYAGLGAGLGIPLLISLIALAFMFLQLRRNKNSSVAYAGTVQHSTHGHPQYVQPPSAMSVTNQNSEHPLYRSYASPGELSAAPGEGHLSELPGANQKR